MKIPALGDIILIADMSGDRPAIITKAYSATSVEATGFMPQPEHIKLVKIHPNRNEAINASQRDSGFHAYQKV